jgi:putative ABC transport system substrate-binding protein
MVITSSSFGGTTWAEAEEIAVIMSRRIAPFEVALRGFRKVVKQPSRVYDLTETSKTKTIRKIMRGSSPKLILAIGSDALRFAQDNFSPTPIVFTMITNPSRIIKKGANITGVRMETPWQVMFKYTKEITPQNRRVGIILNRRRTKEEIEQIKNLAVKHNLELILKTVDNSAEAISEFKNIEDKIEAFIMAPDLYILTPKFYEYILLASLRYKFALVGLSPKYTKAGNLFSVMGNNHNWGVQAGSIANKILSGTSPSHIPYEFAKRYSLSLNLKTAKRIGIKINRSIEQNANIVVK